MKSDEILEELALLYCKKHITDKTTVEDLFETYQSALRELNECQNKMLSKNSVKQKVSY